MRVIDQRLLERETRWMQANREELVERIGRTMRQDGSAQPLPGLHLYRHSIPLKQVYSLVEPSVCVVAQGSKEVPAGREPLPVRPIPLSARDSQSALRQSGSGSVTGASIPQSSPGSCSDPHQRGPHGDRSRLAQNACGCEGHRCQSSGWVPVRRRWFGSSGS